MFRSLREAQARQDEEITYCQIELHGNLEKTDGSRNLEAEDLAEGTKYLGGKLLPHAIVRKAPGYSGAILWK